MNKRLRFILVALFSLLSVISVFLLRVEYFDGKLFSLYTVLVTSYLVFIYVYSYSYKPIPDLGYRPTVSVIIPAKNEEESIQRTIIHTLNSDYPADKLEIIVIDDGSTDNTPCKVRELLASDKDKYKKVVFIRKDINSGKREAMAAGIRIATGEILVSIDSDTFVDKDAIKLLVQPFTNKKVTAVCGHGCVYDKDKNILTKLQHYWYQEMFYILKSMESQLGCVNCCSGILAGYRRETVMPILDEWLGQNFFGIPIIISDDRQLTNLSLRGLKGISNSNGTVLSTKDAEVVYQSNAIVNTVAPDNFKQFIKQQIRWRRGSLHGTLFASKFMWKKKFPIPLYFYPYMYLTYITPFVIFRWLIYKPFYQHEYLGAIAFLSGILYVGFLHGLNVWKYNSDPGSMLYRTMFGIMSLFLTAIILPYAVLTLWKNGWITRANKTPIENTCMTKKPIENANPNKNANEV